MPDHLLKTEPLTGHTFADFGQVVSTPSGSPSSSGNGWQCWFGPEKLCSPDQMLGQVITTPGDGYVRCMERHDSEELLLPVTGAVLQAVCKKSEQVSDEDRPDANTCRVFCVEPGQAIIIAPGVWHAPAYAVTGSTLYFFTGLANTKSANSASSPWIEFANAVVCRITC